MVVDTGWSLWVLPCRLVQRNVFGVSCVFDLSGVLDVSCVLDVLDVLNAR